MGLVFLIVIGGMLGWLAAIIVCAGSAARLRNIVIGIAGALAAGLVVNPLLGGSDLLAGQYSIDALVIALAGAIAVLLVANLWRRGELR